MRLWSDRMRDELGGRVEARRDFHLPRGTTAQASAREDQQRVHGREDRATDAIAVFQRVIRRIDDGINVGHNELDA